MEKSSPVKRFIAKWTNKDRVGYLFILPGVSVLFIFTIIPLLVSFIISLTNLDIFLAWPDMIGLDNFKRTLSDARVWNAFKNTFYYVIVSVPVQLLVALILAYWLYKPTFFNRALPFGILCAGALFLYRHWYFVRSDVKFYRRLYPVCHQ